jgi:hypothetical protein
MTKRYDKNIKYLLIIVTLMFCIRVAPAQAWNWARSFGGLGYDEGHKIATDNNGNSYSVGRFNSQVMNFSSLTMTNTGATADDIYIVKYDSAGNVAWAQSIGSSYECIANDIAIDINGDVLLTGKFGGYTMSIGTLSLNATSAFWDMFLLKINSAGTVLWGKLVGTYNGPTESYAIATDQFANVFITGLYSDASLAIGSTTLINYGDDDMFIAKYTSQGNFLWARSAGGKAWESGSAISCDAFGNPYIAGRFNDSLVIGSTTLVCSGTGSGKQDIFLAKYDQEGGFVWATKAGGTEYDEVTSIVNDNSGNSYITGSYRSDPMCFGSTTFSIVHPYTSDLFLAKYDSSGNVVWATATGGTYADIGYDMTIRDSSLFLLGTYMSSVIPFGTTTLTNSSGNEIETFITNFDLNGNVVWAKSIQGPGHNTGNGISANATSLFVTGSFSGPYFKVGPDSLINLGVVNGFVARYDYATLDSSQTQITSNEHIYPNPGSGQFYFCADHPLDDAEIVITNSFGEKTKGIKNVFGQKILIDCVGLSKGVYVLQVNEKNRKSSKKLIISE